MLVRPEQARFVERSDCINCASSNLHQLSGGRFVDNPLSAFIEADPHGESPLPHLQAAEWNFVRCRDCGQAFHKLILDDTWNERAHTVWMTQDAIRQFCEREGTSSPQSIFEAARTRVAHALRIEKLTRTIRDPHQPVRLLDFGCGYGDFLSVCLGFGFDACGIDRAKPRIDGAAVKIAETLEDLTDAAPFHAVTLFEVLEHLDDPAATLRRLATMMVQGAVLVLETPDCSGVTDIQNHFDYRKISPLDHINAFTHATLRSIAERQGFRLIPRGSAHVTADRLRILKREARHILRLDSSSTQLYFRKA